MRCLYCPACKQEKHMSDEVLYAACELAFSQGNSAGICFFGGEPLLRKEQIYSALKYCQSKSAQTGMPFKCKMTTNGSLLDEDFLAVASINKMEIGISFDGLAQNICRKYSGGGDTLADVENSARLLLKHLPLSYAMMTIAPQAVSYLAQSVEYLYSLGFKRISATPAYSSLVSWTDSTLEELGNQLKQVGQLYSESVINGERLFFSPFDSKITDIIHGTNPDKRCHLGKRQLSVNTDGKLYPCTQFIGDEGYCMGDVFSGVNQSRIAQLSRQSSTPAECKDCELSSRCTNSCGCLNRLETGNENHISPFQCSYERMLIGICDDLAQHLCDEHFDKFRMRFAKMQ